MVGLEGLDVAFLAEAYHWEFEVWKAHTRPRVSRCLPAALDQASQAVELMHSPAPCLPDAAVLRHDETDRVSETIASFQSTPFFMSCLGHSVSSQQ